MASMNKLPSCAAFALNSKVCLSGPKVEVVWTDNYDRQIKERSQINMLLVLKEGSGGLITLDKHINIICKLNKRQRMPLIDNLPARLSQLFP